MLVGVLQSLALEIATIHSSQHGDFEDKSIHFIGGIAMLFFGLF